MKCDHIRTRAQGDTPFFPNMLNNASVEVCLKEDVDAAIDELKTEHHKERDEYISMVHSREQTIKELKEKLDEKECVDFFGFSRQKIGRLIAKTKLKKLVPPFPFIDLTGSDKRHVYYFDKEAVSSWVEANSMG